MFESGEHIRSPYPSARSMLNSGELVIAQAGGPNWLPWRMPWNGDSQSLGPCPIAAPYAEWI